LTLFELALVERSGFNRNTMARILMQLLTRTWTCLFLLMIHQVVHGTQPNVVFLLADDLGYADLGCFGSPVVQSPRLDQLAREGMILKHCYSASPNCSPAPAGILTGRSPYRVGMYDFARFLALHIPAAESTVAERLRSAGYETFFAGKWHCSGDFESGKQPGPGEHGFDHWLAHAKNFGRDPEGFRRNGEPTGPLKGWMSELVVDETIRWLETRDRDSPFFTCLWFSEPHTPVLAAGAFRNLYPKEVTDSHLQELAKTGGPQVKRPGKLRDPDLYFGCISMLDHHIGRLLDYLDSAGLSDDTVVVFTSDNGPEHRTATAFGSPGALRGAKGHIHEGGIRVPGIVRWPGVIEPGKISETPVNGTDWLPTFCAIGGVSIAEGRPIDGANLVPLLSGKGPVHRPVPMLWWLWHARGRFEVAMRDGDYKLVATLMPQANPGGIEDARQPDGWSIMQFIKQAELGRFEMFNLVEDGSETQNLAEMTSQTFQTLQSKMIDLHREIREEGPELELAPRKAGIK
jgi:arylsulfatase A